MFRRFAIALLFFATISATALAADVVFPKLTGRVVDNAHILDRGTIQQLDKMIAAHEQQSSDQIVVVTVPDLQGTTIEDFGYRLGRYWAIGQKDKNNGVLLIVAPKEHKVRIEVGYGLESVLTDAASSIIINRLITPEFKQGDFNTGVLQGVSKIIDTIRGENINDLKPSYSDDTIRLVLLIGVFILFLFFLSRRGRTGVAGPFLSGWIMGQGFNNNDDDDNDSGPSFSGGGGSFGGGGSTGSW